MLTEKDFIYSNDSKFITNGNFEWSAPSNIALIKYWGKIENKLSNTGEVLEQIPANPSISFTLNNCKTITKVEINKTHDGNFTFELLFEGKPKPEFNAKINAFFLRIEQYCNYINDYHFIIDTQNTFPHSSGIASSASAMAAMAMNIMSLEKELNPEITEDYFYKKASFLARLGSGSACRSIKGNTVVWGKNDFLNESSDFYGVEFIEINSIFKDYQDTILIVEKGEKQVSSTVGHELMHNHPFAEKRFTQANENLSVLKKILNNGNLNEFIKIVESEALTLHAMMMTSMPYYILIKPKTLEIINKIWKFRVDTKLPICFTLDAGANVHVLYPKKYSIEIMQFIKDELVAYCQNGEYICDEIGFGAKIV